MNLFFNSIPVVAIVLGQVDSNAAPGALSVYGPLGVICAWLMWRDEKRAKESEKLREAIGDVAHQMRGLNRNLLYVTATHGPDGLKDIAAKELERMTA